MFVLKFLIVILSFILMSCERMEEAEKERLRSLNNQGEYLIRQSNEKRIILTTPEYRSRNPYPWEGGIIGEHSRINKDFFRCKGSILNPYLIIEDKSGQKNHFHDCGGRDKHSLPLKNGKEFIYPILIDLLNYLQAQTGKKIIITSGHRCPQHNSYVDQSIANQSSKHMIGAAVDFYVQGMEQRPEAVLELIKNFFKESPLYQGKKEYEHFQFFQNNDLTPSSTLYNKEIAVKIHKKGEGRNFDNRHSYPYITLQVRYDREDNKKVIYTWHEAQRNILRY